MTLFRISCHLHPRTRMRTEILYRTKCENVETKAGLIRNQARRFSTDQDQRRCPSEERKRLTSVFTVRSSIFVRVRG